MVYFFVMQIRYDKLVGIGVNLLCNSGVFALFGFLIIPAHAHVTRIEIYQRQSPTFDGVRFGAVGQYDRLVGRYHGILDPSDPRLGRIADISLAERNEFGMVEYSADFFMLMPTDLNKGNEAFLYDFGNRGNKYLLNQYNGAKYNNDPRSAADAGNGFLMKQGFSLVWSGSLGDVDAVVDPFRMTIDLPIARNKDGSEIEATVWSECFNDFWTNASDMRVCPLAYPVPRQDQSEVTLIMRERREDPPIQIPASDWEFHGDQGIKLTDGRLFKAGLIYQVVHKAKNPPVMGIGLVAIRDWISFLKSRPTDDFGNPNPIAGHAKFAFSYGLSQSGRMSREFVYLGLNEDESYPGQRVFDGMSILGAATRPFMNFRFAQPARAPDFRHEALYYPNSSFPHAFQDELDPLTGQIDGIFHLCAKTKSCPKVVTTAGAPDYWQLRNSLITTTPDGARDAIIPDHVRVYFFPGVGHSPVPRGYYGSCQYQGLTLSYVPMMRKFLLVLKDWARLGIVPPPSRYPMIKDRTLVQSSLYQWPEIPAVLHPGSLVNPLRIYDFGPEFLNGILSDVLPSEIPSPYGVLVPQVDQDGNEIEGVRLPAVSVPLASYTGWNRRSRNFAIGELCGIMGSEIPFEKTLALRLKTGDPRLSLEERYVDWNDYRDRVFRAADQLISEHYLLLEDRELVINEALDRWFQN